MLYSPSFGGLFPVSFFRLDYSVIPNLLSFLRIFLILPMVVFFVLGNYGIDFSHNIFFSSYSFSLWCFLVASLTDFLDGVLARHFHWQTDFGSFLDPLADKLVVITAIILLLPFVNGILFTLSSIIIIAREFTIQSLRDWLEREGSKNGIAVNYLGKTKTLLQMSALVFILAHHIAPQFMDLGLILYHCSAIITFVTFLNYLYELWQKQKQV